MCVAAVAWKAHPRWLLVAIGNRDEFHERPAAPLAEWSGDARMIAGRDLRSGGTWLGVSPAGRFALVTNLRGHGDADPSRASRGSLVTDLLARSGRYGDPETAPLDAFNPFNLILADAAEAHFLTNRPAPLRTRLAHGIFGVSNGALDEPWPKVLALEAALNDWLESDRDETSPDFAPLFAALRSESLDGVGSRPTQPADAPDTPPFIRHPIYGTRCGTVVAIGRDGAGWIVERRFTPDGGDAGETTIRFAWTV